jgi:hypothetical protein
MFRAQLLNYVASYSLIITYTLSRDCRKNPKHIGGWKGLAGALSKNKKGYLFIRHPDANEVLVWD